MDMDDRTTAVENESTPFAVNSPSSSTKETSSDVIKTELFTDYRWGCMWRCGQMLLARILKLYMGDKYDMKHSVSLFLDYPYCPFSIHKICSFAYTNEMSYPGKFIGPHTIAMLLKHFVSNQTKYRINFYTPSEYCIYENHIDKLFEDLDGKSPLVMFIRLRLGQTKFNIHFKDSIKMFLDHQTCLGILGGVNQSGYYIVGYSDDQVLAADPHVLQVTPHMTDHIDCYINEYRCNQLTVLNFDQLDPSMTLCCYFKDKKDYTDWKEYSIKNDLCMDSKNLVSTNTEKIEANTGLFFFTRTDEANCNATFIETPVMNDFTNVTFKEA